MNLKEENWKLYIKWIEQANSGRAAARNKGAEIASSDILLFLDDDTIPESNVVFRHFQHHQEGNSVLVGNHPVIASKSDHDFQKFRQYLSKKWLRKLPSTTEQPIPADRPFLTAAHFSIKKSLFNELGGFDQRLSDSEDFELAIRLIKRNNPIYFDRKLIAVHFDNVDLKGYIARLREYKKANDELLAKGDENPLIRNKYHSYNDINIFKKVTYGMLCRNTVLSIVDRSPQWIKIIPLQLRFKIYDLLITGYSSYFPQLKI